MKTLGLAALALTTAAACGTTPTPGASATTTTGTAVASGEKTDPSGAMSMGPAPSAAPSAEPASSGKVAIDKIPEKGSPSGPAKRQEIMERYLDRLHKAGSAGACDAETALVVADLAVDARLSDEDLRSEQKLRDTTTKGSMPYPDQGTMCSLFGVQRALDRAISERASAREK